MIEALVIHPETKRKTQEVGALIPLTPHPLRGKRQTDRILELLAERPHHEEEVARILGLSEAVAVFLLDHLRGIEAVAWRYVNERWVWALA